MTSGCCGDAQHRDIERRMFKKKTCAEPALRSNLLSPSRIHYDHGLLYKVSVLCLVVFRQFSTC